VSTAAFKNNGARELSGTAGIKCKTYSF
jgi:hypothetical protein